MNDECVEFVEELVIGRKGGLEHLADFLVGELGVNVTVAFQDATGVGVDYEDGMFAGVEKDGVGGFRADAAEGEKLSAKNVRASGEKAGKGAGVGCVEEVYERLERFGFLAEVAGGPEKLRQPRGANASDGLRREQARSAQITNGALDVGPRSILREDGADNNFKAAAARPPMLGAMGCEERVKIGAQRRVWPKSGLRRFTGDALRAGVGRIGENRRRQDYVLNS